ncbi:MAG TPA: GXWXG domain-containing protein [Polyangiales bacterium]
MKDLQFATAGDGPVTMSPDDALALFDSLPACPVETLRGQWSGREVLTGHPLDGALANISWYGKQFDSDDQVHPLLVRGTDGRPFPLDPSFVPMRLIAKPMPTPRWVKRVAPSTMSLLRGPMRARRYGAKLSSPVHRGKATAAMSYVGKPITDYFRKIDEHTVLGLMEYAGMPRPYFFLLRRDRA